MMLAHYSCAEGTDSAADWWLTICEGGCETEDEGKRRRLRIRRIKNWVNESKVGIDEVCTSSQAGLCHSQAQILRAYHPVKWKL